MRIIRVKNKKYERSVPSIAWHHEITTTEATPCNTQPERSGDGGHLAAQHAPKTLRLMHGTGRGYVLWICKADIEAGMYSIVDLSRSQYTVPEAAAGRRSARDGIASLAIHAADAMSPTRTQALSSAEKELEPFPFERNVACYSLSRPTTHGCHVPLTAWDPRRFLNLPGSVLSGCSSSDGLEGSQHDGRVVTTPKPRVCPCCDGHQQTAQGYQEVPVGVAVVQ